MPSTTGKKVGPFSIKKCHGSSGTFEREDKQEYIVVHYTAGGSGAAGGAESTCAFFKSNGSGSNTGAEYCIDSETICEYADPKLYRCKHCGDGKGKYGITNENSIGIEVVAPAYQPNPYTDGEIAKLT